MSLGVGSQLGHYDVTTLIGEGGMGEGYRVRDHWADWRAERSGPLSAGVWGGTSLKAHNDAGFTLIELLSALLAAIRRIVHVSLETVRMVEGVPAPFGRAKGAPRDCRRARGARRFVARTRATACVSALPIGRRRPCAPRPPVWPIAPGSTRARDAAHESAGRSRPAHWSTSMARDDRLGEPSAHSTTAPSTPRVAAAGFTRHPSPTSRRPRRLRAVTGLSGLTWVTIPRSRVATRWL